MEIYKLIKEFNTYEVSNIGNVRNIKTGRILKPRSRGGYLAVNLYNNGQKSPDIHRLVAKAFIPNINNSPVVNHINGNKADNRVENLEWCTVKENNIHTFKTLYNKALIVVSKETGEILHEINIEDCFYRTIYLRK